MFVDALLALLSRSAVSSPRLQRPKSQRPGSTRTWAIWSNSTGSFTRSPRFASTRADVEARCNGRIRFEAAGGAGFGYDPLFEIVEYHRTVAELGGAVKACFSHRARAIGQLIPQLIRLRSEATTL